MKGASSSIAGCRSLRPVSFHTLTAVPALLSWATIGWQVSVWFSTSIFQLQRCM